MSDKSTDNIREVIDSIYRSESRRILATLIRLLGDIDTAEEVMHEAFAAAMERWSIDGVPDNPRAWLISTGRFKGIDNFRRHSRFDASQTDLINQLESGDDTDPSAQADRNIKDDELRLIFTCCHPALSPETRTALTLREVCGLTTEEIARAFLTTAPTIAQRIVRGKSKIRDARIPYQVPTQTDLPDRLETVLQVIYLVFNEGYSASSGESLTRPYLSGEAIRLCRLLVELLPASRVSGAPEQDVLGLLALMLLQESRRVARSSPDGDLILLEDQDRSLWNRDQIAEGLSLVQILFASRQVGPYTLQAAIAAVHARATSATDTNWDEIVRLYDLLLQLEPSPVIELNRAVAIAMRDGPLLGLMAIDKILARGDLTDYHLVHSAQAELYRRIGRIKEARTSYQKALTNSKLQPERRFLEKRLKELG